MLHNIQSRNGAARVPVHAAMLNGLNFGHANLTGSAVGFPVVSLTMWASKGGLHKRAYAIFVRSRAIVRTECRVHKSWCVQHPSTHIVGRRAEGGSETL